MNRAEGIRTARKLKELLKLKKYPIRQVFLFGSVAKGTAHVNSDIDVAIVTDPFLPSRMKEGSTYLRLSKNIDMRIETVCLHPEDLKKPFFTLGKEIERTGVEV